MNKVLKSILKLSVLLGAVLSASSCDWLCPGGNDKDKTFSKVLILYGAGFNSLSNALQEDIRELSQGEVPAKDADVAIAVINHCNSNGYANPTSPVIFRMYKDSKGKAVYDTLTTLSATDLLTDKEVMKSSLNYVASTLKSDHYGLILSSHGTGWLPEGYYGKPSDYEPALDFAPGKTGAARRMIGDGPLPGPAVRSFGEEYYYDGATRKKKHMDITDLGQAIPFHFDYIVFDACLMGCIETVFELKDKCSYLGLSPSEILEEGMQYTTTAGRLLRSGLPDLEGLIDDYFEYYDSKTGLYRSASYTLIDCSKIDALATACKPVFEKYRSQIAAVDPEAVQPYCRGEKHWIYDLRDILLRAGATRSDLSSVDEALSRCVLKEVHTPTFFNNDEYYGGYEFKNCCGLGMYLPCDGTEFLDAFYKTLSWNKATSLVQ